MGFTIHPRIAWQMLDQEAVLIDLEQGNALGLNATGSLLWPLLPRCGPAELAEALVAEFEVNRDLADRDVAAFLTLLRERGLIEP